MGFKIFVGMVIFIIIFTTFCKIRYYSPENQEKIKNAAKEKQARIDRYSGRAEGKIIEHHWETTMSARVASRQREDDMDVLDHIYIVSYEFEVDGKIYTGKGEGSPAFQVRKKQTICYDPSDPNVNCTLFYLNIMKDSL